MDQLGSITVLGIDPGTTRLGYAVVRGNPQSLQLITSGILGDARMSKGKRLKLLYEGLQAVIKTHAPDMIAIEKLFFSKNVSTALEVAEARGMILLTAAIADLRVYECSPQEVKIALCSHGRAAKSAVAAMVRHILKISALPVLDDESDAMAVAITGIVLGRESAKGR
jgi:crossover junction endodeoxyribonuclease RuvC